MTTYYVDKDTGSDLDDGLSLGNAWETINHAASQVAAGDTVNIVTAATSYAEGFTETTDGSSGNEIVFRSWTPDDPAIITSAGWFIDADYWIFEYLIFDGNTASSIYFGFNSASANCTVRYCHFRHLDDTAIWISDSDGLHVHDCWLYDIRSRIAGDDENAIEFKIASENTLIERCAFEDIGSDGIQVLPNLNYSIKNTVIKNCAFWVNRPYGATTRTWQDFSTNVGENAIDIKNVTDDDEFVTVERCLAYDFIATVAGQDASGASGEAFISHINSVHVLFRQCRAYDSEVGIVNSGLGGVIENNIVHDCSRYGIDIRNCATGVTAIHNTIIDCTDYLRLVDSDVIFYDNFISGGDDARGGTNNEDFDYNAWYNLDSALPAQWVGANDPTITTTDLDDEMQPGSSSDVLNAGTNRGLAYDQVYRIRDLTPSCGGYEQPESDGFVLNLDGNSLLAWNDSASDTDHEIFLVPSTIDGMWRYAIYIKDTTAHYHQFDLSGSKTFRIAFYVEPATLKMASGDSFRIAKFDDGGTTAAIIDLRYSAGNYYIAARIRDDSASDHYVGTSSGFSLGDNDRHLIEVNLFYAANPGDNDGFIELWIDDVSKGSSTGINNDTLTPDGFEFGAVGGIDAGTGDDENFEAVFYIDSIRINNTGGVIGERNFAFPELPTVSLSDANIQGYWRMEEVSGTRADSTPNANTLQDNNTVLSSVDAKEGVRSADLERSNSEYLDITDGAQTGLGITGPITVCGWIQPETDGGVFQIVASKYNAGTEQSWAFFISSGSPDQIKVSISADGSSDTDAIGLSTITAGEWTHVTFVYDGENIFIYFDGELDTNFDDNPKAFSSGIFDSNAPFRVGAFSGGAYFDGLIDALSVFDRALTGAEVRYIYENNISLIADVPVKAYYYRRRRI